MVSLRGDLLTDTGTDYIFNLTVVNFVGLYDWNNFIVQRSEDAIFDVQIFTNVDGNAVKRYQRYVFLNLF